MHVVVALVRACVRACVCVCMSSGGHILISQSLRHALMILFCVSTKKRLKCTPTFASLHVSEMMWSDVGFPHISTRDSVLYVWPIATFCVGLSVCVLCAQTCNKSAGCLRVVSVPDTPKIHNRTHSEPTERTCANTFDKHTRAFWRTLRARTRQVRSSDAMLLWGVRVHQVDSLHVLPRGARDASHLPWSHDWFAGGRRGLWCHASLVVDTRATQHPVCNGRSC
jgi:hypothetical protein